MIKVLEGLPPNVVGIEAVGRVDAADYRRVLEPAVERALQAHDKLRLLYVLGDEFDGYSPSAAWEDTKLGISHWHAWERLAVVTDREWIRDGVRALGWMLPGECRVYTVERRDKATAWVSA